MFEVDLTKGSFALDLTKDLPTLKRLKISASWDKHPLANSKFEKFDLDLVAYVQNKQGKVTDPSEIVYYKNMNFKDAIILPEDNQEGGDKSEDIFIDFSKVPDYVGTIAVYLTIHEFEKRQQNLGMIVNAKVELSDLDSGTIVGIYNLTKDYSGDTAVHLCDLARQSNGFVLEPQGVGAVADINSILKAYF